MKSYWRFVSSLTIAKWDPPSKLWKWFLLFLAMPGYLAFSQELTPKTMAITVDDLPYAGSLLEHKGKDATWIQKRTGLLLDALAAEAVSATGFVNESKLLVSQELDARVAVLAQWLGAGMDLGNHTFSHLSLSQVTPQEFEADILRGEMVTRWLLKEQGKDLRFFRYPFNHRGPSAAIRDRVHEFLEGHGYRVAPFTLDHSDYLFNSAYIKAHRLGNNTQLRRIKTAYLDHLREKIAFFEKLSMQLFKREIPQILLIHANELNTDCMAELLAVIKNLGYRFVSLENALKDEAYKTPDQFVGTYGPSWLHRYSVTLGVPMVERKGKKFPAFLLDEPDPPSWILD